MTTYCDVNTCEDCPRYGDDCDGDKRIEPTDLIKREDAVKTVIRKCSPICAWQVGTQQYPDCVVAEINALPSAELTLQTPQTYGKSINPSKAELNELCDMAIEALSAKPNKAVPPSLADVYKWERDIALSQLEEYGICFGEKKRDDLVEVVRCKDCRWWNGSQETMHNNHLCRNWSKFGSINTSADDYCSYGERREG